MEIYILCGLPASGKTTYAQQLAKDINAKLYCFDEYKIQARKLTGMTSHERMYSEIKQDLIDGHNVVLDDLHLALEWRQPLLSALQNITCTKKLIVMTTPLEECIRRNTQRNNGLPNPVIYHLNRRYQPPSLDEGWDDIIFI